MQLLTIIAAATPKTREIGDTLAEQGRVLATLDDWRAITFVLVMVMAILIGVIVVLLRTTRQERSDMATERARMWAVADKFGEAANKLTIQLGVTEAIMLRVEKVLSDCEDEHAAGRIRPKR